MRDTFKILPYIYTPPTHKKATTRKSLHAKPHCYTELAKL